MKTFYFSATGNSLYVAKTIGGDLISVDRCLRAGLLEYSDDVIGFIYPVHFGGVPQPMLDFVQQATLHANYFFVIQTYGHLPGNALRRFIRSARRQSIRIHYAAGIEMVDTYLPMFAVDRELSLVPKRCIEEHLAEIHYNIEHHVKRKASWNLFSALLSFVEQRMLYYNMCSRFTVDNTCTKCGTCVAVCPQRNVQLCDDSVVFGNRCISCLACIHACPQRVIHLQGERSTERYINPNVSLRELMK